MLGEWTLKRPVALLRVTFVLVLETNVRKSRNIEILTFALFSSKKQVQDVLVSYETRNY